MLLLDENIFGDERILLEPRGLSVHQVGVDWFKKGVKDDHLLALLRSGRGVTLFTRDRGLYRKDFCHRSYCIAVLEVYGEEVAYHVAFSQATSVSDQGIAERSRCAGTSAWHLLVPVPPQARSARPLELIGSAEATP